MSNYEVIVSWNGKDDLADTDDAKVISGDDFHTEFTAVRTAINSKAELNGSATESFSATTAVSGNNTTQVATTAFVQSEFTKANINGHAYPVGSIYTAVVSTNPATLLGVGTWSAFGSGRVLVGVDTGDSDFNTVEETGGSKTHALTESEMPKHFHRVWGPHTSPGDNWQGIDGTEEGSLGSSAGNFNGGTPDDAASLYATHSTGGAASSGSESYGSGNGNTHNNVQPYITVYMWKRTA